MLESEISVWIPKQFRLCLVYPPKVGKTQLLYLPILKNNTNSNAIAPPANISVLTRSLLIGPYWSLAESDCIVRCVPSCDWKEYVDETGDAVEAGTFWGQDTEECMSIEDV